MVKNQIDILIKTLYERTGVKASIKDLDRLKFGLTKTGRVVDSMTKGPIKDMNKVMRDMGKRAMPRFQMGWLSVMFAAMKVKKIMTGLWKDMIQTMKKVGGKMHPLNLAMTRLTAGFTYLKFSILEAMGPMLNKFVIWLANMAISIADMPEDKLREIGYWLIAITGVAFVAGFIAEFALLAGGINMLSKGGIAKGLWNTHAALSAIKGIASFYLIYKGIKDFSEGGIMASVDELIALALIWFVGLGWGIGFYLIAQGFKAVTGEEMGVWIKKEVQGIQEKLNEQRLYFPAEFGKPTQLFPGLKDTIAGDVADWIYKLGQTLIPGGGKGFLAPVITDMDTLSKQFVPVNTGFETMNEKVQAVDESLTKKSLVPSMDMLLDSIINNIAQLPLMALELVNVKAAIDAIPDHTTKIVEIKTIRTGDDSGSRGRVQTTTPYGN